MSQAGAFWYRPSSWWVGPGTGQVHNRPNRIPSHSRLVRAVRAYSLQAGGRAVRPSWQVCGRVVRRAKTAYVRTYVRKGAGETSETSEQRGAVCG